MSLLEELERLIAEARALVLPVYVPMTDEEFAFVFGMEVSG